jgi:integral membrane protein
MTSTTEPTPAVQESAPGGGALVRYRVMAYVVGTLLVVLVFGVVIDNHAIEKYLGIAHGYLYMVLLLTIGDLWRRRRFPFKVVPLVALAGTIPFLSFVAEHMVTARVHDGRF